MMEKMQEEDDDILFVKLISWLTKFYHSIDGQLFEEFR